MDFSSEVRAMTDLQKEINQAFKLISAVPVSGDGVDVMAAAREHLRTAYQMAAPTEEDGSDG